jgi:hypothetical protein
LARFGRKASNLKFMKKILNACMLVAVVLVWASCGSTEEPKAEAPEVPVEQAPAPIDTNQLNKVDTTKKDTTATQKPDPSRT